MKSKSRNGKLSRAAWIREQPMTMPAAEVVELGEIAGYEMSLAAVHRARWQARVGAKKPKRTAPVRQARGVLTIEKIPLTADFDYGAAFRELVRAAVREEMSSLMRRGVG